MGQIYFSKLFCQLMTLPLSYFDKHVSRNRLPEEALRQHPVIPARPLRSVTLRVIHDMTPVVAFFLFIFFLFSHHFLVAGRLGKAGHRG